MPMIEINTKVEIGVVVRVWCSTCGADLCQRTEVIGDLLYVEACPNCIKKAREEEYKEGYDKGWHKGYRDGYDNGCH